MSRNVRKRTFENVQPTKTQISLRDRAVWSESSLDAFWIAKDVKFLHADNECSNQPARMRRLNWAFVGRTMSEGTFSYIAAYRIFWTKYIWRFHVSVLYNELWKLGYTISKVFWLWDPFRHHPFVSFQERLRDWQQSFAALNSPNYYLRLFETCM